MGYKEAINIFSLTDNYTISELKKSYRKLMKKYHPDLHTNDMTQQRKFFEQKAKEINEAYEVLSENLKNGHKETKIKNIEIIKQEIIKKLNLRLNNVKNYFKFNYSDNVKKEIYLIETTIKKITTCQKKSDISTIISNFNLMIVQNNIDMFDRFISTWEIDNIGQSILTKLYLKYQVKVRNAQSVIEIIKLITELKEEYYYKLNEYEITIRSQINQRLDNCILKYKKNAFFCFASAKITEIKKNIENQIFNNYIIETNQKSLNNLITDFCNELEKNIITILNIVKKRNEKISYLYNYYLNNNEFDEYLNLKIKYLYENITDENFNNFYDEIKNEIADSYKLLTQDKSNLVYIAYSFLKKYIVELTSSKKKEKITEITILYRQIIFLLSNIFNEDITLNLFEQLQTLDFVDLNYTKRIIDNIIFDIVDSDLYVKRNKSKINGNIIKVNNIDGLVQYYYIEDKTNNKYTAEISSNEFFANYISLKDFIKKAKFVGKFAKIKPNFFNNIKVIALYEDDGLILYFDVSKNQFYFTQGDVNYLANTDISDNLKDKSEVYKILLQQYLSSFSEKNNIHKRKKLIV